MILNRLAISDPAEIATGAVVTSDVEPDNATSVTSPFHTKSPALLKTLR